MSEKYDFDKLTSRDRVNYPYLLACRLLSIQEAEKSGNDMTVSGSILGLYSDIPDELKDEQFEDELQKCTEEIKVDDRPLWCGIRCGPPKWKIETKFHPSRMKHACINLLQRKNMLTRESQTEKFPGKT